MNLTFFLRRAAAATAACALSALAFAVPVSYNVVVNTPDLLGDSALIDLQFNPSTAAALAGTATITNFAPGASVGAVDSATGDVSGDLSMQPVIFTNSTPFNSLLQALTLPGVFSFTVTFDGAMLGAASADSTIFAMSLYDTAFNPLGSNDPSGLLLTFNIGLGAIEITSFGSPTGTNDPRVTATLVGPNNPTPLPATLALLMIGAAALSLRAKRSVA
jgi:hypothetical protein